MIESCRVASLIYSYGYQNYFDGASNIRYYFRNVVRLFIYLIHYFCLDVIILCGWILFVYS